MKMSEHWDHAVKSPGGSTLQRRARRDLLCLAPLVSYIVKSMGLTLTDFALLVAVFQESLIRKVQSLQNGPFLLRF